MKTERFIERLLELSVSSDFFSAQKEWEVDHLEYVGDDTCICGQKHINKVVVIRNKHTNSLVRIGYNCYHTTLNGVCYDTEFKKLMYEYKLSRLGIFKIPTAEQIIDNYCRYIINEWEFKFLISIKRFSEYSEKQLQILKNLIPRIQFDSQLTREISRYGTITTEELTRMYVVFKGDNFETYLDDFITRGFKKISW